ncbi:UNVERIFIED_CONTAM: fermentation-respiration switch protein FrsA (DUF1100 family) [Acetivibrio alkalicellulosi]
MRISGITYTHYKSHGSKKIILVIFALAFIATLIVAIISTYTAWKLTRPEKRSLPIFSANIVPEYENISFRDINSEIILRGWFFDAPGGSDKTIVIAHGYGGNRLPFGEDTIDLIKSYLSEGYNILTFDFRNSGESDGNITSVGLYEKNDLLGAINYAKSRGSEKVILLGYSMGASTCIMAAAESEHVDGIIADSPFSDLTAYLNENLRVWSVWSNWLPTPFNKTTLIAMKLLTGIDTSDVSPVNYMNKISHIPILLIHSEDDKVIPIEHSHALKSSSNGSNVELWKTKGATHIKSYTKYPDGYINRTIEFLNLIGKEEEEDTE